MSGCEAGATMTDPRDAAGKKSAARFGWQWVYLVFPYVWLFFLVFPAMQAWGEHGSRRVMGVTLVTVFAVTYVALFAHLIHDSWLRIDRLGLALCGVLIVVFVLAIDFFTLHGEALVFLPFMLAALMYTLPGRVGAGVGLALLLGTIVLLLSTGMLASSSFIVVIGLVTYGVNLAELWTMRREARAAETERTAIVLAERNRVASDVHDLLGHSLTVANLKLQLIERLMDEDPARAHQELADTRAIITEALADVRRTVDLERTTTLADELAGASMTLSGAGLEARVSGDPEIVRGPIEFVLGRVVREATTNILRHAHASRVEIEVSPSRLTVRDDGDGLSPTHVDGNGLRAMRERVAEAGGALSVGPGTLGGTEVTVTW